MFLSPI